MKRINDYAMNRQQVIFFLFVVSLFAFLSAAMAEATVTPTNIIISEVQITGGAGHTNNEFVRLSATDSNPVALTGFKLIQTKFSEKKSSCADETLVPTSKFTAKSIPGNGSLLIAHPEYEGADVVDIFYAKSNTLTENIMRISLLDERGNLVAKKTIGTRCEAEQETDTIPPSVPDTPPPTDSGVKTIRINELLPNPKSKGDSGEFIELYNFGSREADLSGWTLRDATKTGKYTFPPKTSITASGYLVVTDQSFKLSLNNTNEIVSLFDETETLIDTVRYEKTKEDISLNYTAGGWRGGTPTPEAENILNNLPAIQEKVPKKGFKNTVIDFTARGKDDDGDTIKYIWDFGDGHKSYKNKTTHRYEKNGKYIVTLRTTGGKDDVTETFTVKIRSYDPPKVRITVLSPNPRDKDSDNEWMLIENREKKTVNLKDFSIATGWKKLTNHPVRADFFIPPKQEAKLTRAASLFTLPNQKGKIELRAPDGSVLQKIKYRLETSITEDAVYTKEKGRRWEWQTKQTAVSSQQTTEGESLLTADETDQESGMPEEKMFPEETPPPAEESEESTEQKVLGATTSRTDDADKKRWQLVSAGTRVQISDSVLLNPEILPREPSSVPPEGHYAVSFARTSLSEINAALNQWMNTLP